MLEQSKGDEYKRNVEQNVADAINLLPKLATVRTCRVERMQPLREPGVFVPGAREKKSVIRQHFLH